jgi:hypothetical protein
MAAFHDKDLRTKNLENKGLLPSNVGCSWHDSPIDLSPRPEDGERVMLTAIIKHDMSFTQTFQNIKKY